MSANRPAFANSLVAMYGSSPETSDDESDAASAPQLPSNSAENVGQEPESNASCPKAPKESEKGSDMDMTENDSNFPSLQSITPEAAASLTLTAATEASKENESIDQSKQTCLQETSSSTEDLSTFPTDIILSEPKSTENTIEDSSDVSVNEEENPESDVASQLDVGVARGSLPESSVYPESSSHSRPQGTDFAKEKSTAEISEKVISKPAQDLCNLTVLSNIDESIKNVKTTINTSPEDEEVNNMPGEIEETDKLNSISELIKESKSEKHSEFNLELVAKIGSAKQPDLNVGSGTESDQIGSSQNVLLDEDTATLPNDCQNVLEKSRQSLIPEKTLAGTPAGRRLRQIRHPSAKAAEAAADAAFVAAVTPTRKNLKEAKIASALAKVADSPDVSLVMKKTLTSQSTTRTRKGRSSSGERSSDSRSSPLVFSAKEDSGSNETGSVIEGKLTTINEDVAPDTNSDAKEETESSLTKATGFIEGEKPVGIKLKISRESVQILDPTLPKLEVQIPTESASSEVTCSPGGTKRMRKFKEGTLSPNPSLSPITLKIAKSKEGLEVVSSENASQVPAVADSEVAKVEKITLKLSRDEGATIVKPALDEVLETRPEKLTLKLVKDESSKQFTSVHSQDEVEEAKCGKIFLKLSKGEGACIVKRKDSDTFASSSDIESCKLERITLKRSTDNNVSIVRSKDLVQLERGASASPEPGKVEKITLKVSKNDNVSIVKPASPTPSLVGVEKLTLRVSKDGTAAVSGKQSDDFMRDGESSKLEKITIKLSKEDGVSIVKPASPVPDKKALKLTKEEPLSPLSPLTIAHSGEVEPQKERITLKLSKAGGHPSPVGVTDERSSWSIKSTDSDTVPSPVPSDPVTPKSRPKRAMTDTPETVPSSAKKLKLSELDKSDDSNSVPVTEVQEKRGEFEQRIEVENMDIVMSKEELEPDLESEGTNLEEEISVTKTCTVGAPQDDSMEVILLDSEESLNETALPTEYNQSSIPIIDIENEIPCKRIMKRKPRGRPRKSVLTPGAISAEIPVDSTPEDSSSTPKPKRERIRPEPTESERPKRSCKGREKPPPKPVKPTKPRGRAALAKQKAEQSVSIQPEEPQLFEEETRMSADCGTQSEISGPTSIMSVVGNGLIAKVVVARLTNLDKVDQSTPTTPNETPADSPAPIITNEESQASQGSVSLVSSTAENTPNRGNRKGRMEINVDPDAQAEFTVDMIAEYLWPPNDGHGETHMIQEQISAYLGVKSFKRKYPNMQRRAVDHDERQYLLERKLVSESLCDLGLTALPSHEVLDVLCTDFPEKFEEYRRFTRERVQREFSSKQKAFLAGGAAAKEDSKSKAMRNMASFNAMLNRSRRDQRRACFDLQSFTVHYPEDRRRRMSIPNLPCVGPYPLALVPGQYTDFYKEYTAAELHYFPLNTVLYGPLLPHEMRMHAGGSEGSQTDSSDSSSSDSSSSDSDSSGSDSDSDSDSSSESGDDSSSQVVTGTVESPEGEVDRPDAVCRVCGGDRLKNKIDRPEPLVHCASCEKSGHLSCLDLTVDMMPHIRKYSWHCTDCKLCAQCNDTADEDKMLFCDMCDRGYHIYCVGLRKVPEGRWHCQECAVCASCAAHDPGGTEATQTQSSQDTPTKADTLQWQHEFKKGDKGARIYVRTLCVPCSKLWKKGRYCRLCWKCFTNQPEEEGLINCSICDRWMHADCCRKAGRVIDFEKLSSYICELCQQKGVRVSANKSPVKQLR